METLHRHSPIALPGNPSGIESRQNWQVVLEYEQEGDGPWLVDLSHLPKWDLQGENLERLTPGGLAMPEQTLDCTYEDSLLITRVKSNWAMIWDLSGSPRDPFDDFACTDVTESYSLLAVIGRETFALMEKVSSLDLTDPLNRPPFLLLGPVLHVRSQTVVLARDGLNTAVLIAAPRAYGQNMAKAMLKAGEEWSIRPAGENRFFSLQR